MTTDTPPLGERLVQAAAEASYEQFFARVHAPGANTATPWDECPVEYRRYWAEGHASVAVVAAVLPLLVEAIEAARDEHEQSATGQAPAARAIRIVRAVGMDAAIDVIRSAAEAVSR